MEDRRIFERIEAKFPVKYLDPMAAKEGQASTLDICANGVCFMTNEKISRNSSLEMWIEIPDKREPLYTRGAVVWCNEISDTKENKVGVKVGVKLERAELMGLARALWIRKA